MRGKYRAAEKERHLEQWKSRGKSAASYAAEQGIAQSTFSKWVIADRNTSSGGIGEESSAAASGTYSSNEVSSETKKQESTKPRFVEIRPQNVFSGQNRTTEDGTTTDCKIKDFIITIRKSGFEIDVPVSAGSIILEAVLRALQKAAASI